VREADLLLACPVQGVVHAGAVAGVEQGFLLRGAGRAPHRAHVLGVQQGLGDGLGAVAGQRRFGVVGEGQHDPAGLPLKRWRCAAVNGGAGRQQQERASGGQHAQAAGERWAREHVVSHWEALERGGAGVGSIGMTLVLIAACACPVRVKGGWESYFQAFSVPSVAWRGSPGPRKCEKTFPSLIFKYKKRPSTAPIKRAQLSKKKLALATTKAAHRRLADRPCSGAQWERFFLFFQGFDFDDGK